MATKKKGRAKKSAKAAPRKRAARKSAARRTASKAGTRRPKRRQRVLKAVGSKARQGLDMARSGLERLKQSTATLVEDVKERIAGADDASGVRGGSTR